MLILTLLGTASAKSWRGKEQVMRMTSADRWLCSNPACGCQVLVETAATAEGTNPRCSCGAKMKKKYTLPALAYLESLRLEEAPAAAARRD